MSDLLRLYEELFCKISTLSSNILKFVNEARIIGIQPEISILSRSSTNLKRNIGILLNQLVTTFSKDREMANPSEIESLRNKYTSLQKEWDSQQEHLGRLQGDIYALRNQLRVQSAFCASLGSILGNLLWKVSRLQPAVELLISTNKIDDLFSITTGSLASFVETYGESGLPEIFSDETQFILSLVGVVANIAAVPEGRHILVSHESGKTLLEQVIQSLTVVPLNTGEPLLRILLMVIYNASIHEGGLSLLQDKKPLLVTAAEVIACDRSPQLKLIALRLLDSVTFGYPNVAVYNLHKALMPWNKLKTIATDTDAEMRGFAVNILKNLDEGRIQFSLDTPATTAFLQAQNST